MAVTAKIIASTLGAGGIIILGCYAGGVFGGVEWYSLTETEANSYTGKVGGKYWMYLTGVENSNNAAWWQESYQTYEKDIAKEGSDARQVSDHFAKGKIEIPYSTSNNKALNKVCGEAYKKDLTNEVDFASTTTTENKYKLAADILRYCSPLEKQPTIMEQSDVDTYTNANAIGKQGITKKLVKVTGDENDKFWTWQNEWFKSLGNKTPPLDAYFGQFFKSQSGKKVLQSDENIKEICAKAYKATAKTDGDSTKEQPKIDDVAKYCAFIKA